MESDKRTYWYAKLYRETKTAEAFIQGVIINLGNQYESEGKMSLMLLNEYEMQKCRDVIKQ